jgi:hypothetical protein
MLLQFPIKLVKFQNNLLSTKARSTILCGQIEHGVDYIEECCRLFLEIAIYKHKRSSEQLLALALKVAIDLISKI